MRLLIGKRQLYRAVFIAYLHNSIFPPLLSAAEEADCIARMGAGEQQARNMLIEHNLRLVAYICKKFDMSGVDKDDLISIGTIGLIKAIDSFSPQRGARLATYAARCIENEVLMHLRSLKNVKTEMSLQDPVGVDKEGNEVTLLDILGHRGETVTEQVEFAEELRLLRGKLTVLDERERYVICLRYGIGEQPRLTQRQIAQRLGISRSYVSRIEKKAVAKLAAALRQDIG
ncbi:MAG: RNA polymerase sporulation sigma factor SigK [Bacillota bacterium]|nr:RNA polymerase sporulation sigma factor SigK [Bacillota bacterium]